MVVAAEGAVVLGRPPNVVLRLQQHHGEGQAHSRERLREGDDVRLDAHLLEGEEAAGAPAARLNVVDDQQAAVLVRELLHAAQPARRGGQIGRASGRESRCQYVSISVVAGYIKK